MQVPGRNQDLWHLACSQIIEYQGKRGLKTCLTLLRVLLRLAIAACSFFILAAYQFPIQFNLYFPFKWKLLIKITNVLHL